MLELCELPESVVVGSEVQIPYYSEHIDVVLCGHDTQGCPSVVLIELKQWTKGAGGNDGRLGTSADLVIGRVLAAGLVTG